MQAYNIHHRPHAKKLKEELVKFRLPDSAETRNPRRFVWDRSDADMAMAQAVFRSAVLSQELQLVQSFVSNLLPNQWVEDKEDEQLAHLLINRTTANPTKEALLMAISIGSRPLVEFILQLFQEFPAEEHCGCATSLIFPAHVTPLMAAAISNNFAIVECLLHRGHSLLPPHRTNCKCKSCDNEVVSEEFRLDLFRALASDTFLWLGTPDPFSAARTLASDLQHEMSEALNGEHFQKLLQNVEIFMENLVKNCNKREEVSLLLGDSSFSTSAERDSTLPRLRQSLDGSFKLVGSPSTLKHIFLSPQFLSNSRVRETASALFWQGWGDFGSSSLRDGGRIVRHALLYPFFALLFTLSNGTLASSFNVPAARFLSFTWSFVVFFVAALTMKWHQMTTAHYDRSLAGNALATVLQLYIFVYILGLVLDRFVELYRRGWRIYFSLWWRWLDFFFLGFFLLAGHIWLSVLYIRSVEGEELGKLHRRHWPAYEHMALYDLFLAFGCTLAFWKIFYFAQLIGGIGPTIISIARCSAHVVHYQIVMFLTLFSFAFGCFIIIIPYKGNEMIGEGGQIVKQSRYFTSLGESIRNLFWSIFGYLDPSYYSLVLGNAGPSQSKMSSEMVSVGAELMVVIFHLVLVISLLNLMISLFVKKADEVQDNITVEYEYIRICIYAEFFEDASSVPPPFNLLFLPIRGICNLIQRKYRLGWPEILQTKVEDRTLAWSAYKGVLRTVFTRYRDGSDFRYNSEKDSEKKKNSLMTSPKFAFME